MEPGKLVLAKDGTSERAQFSALGTDQSENITTPTQLNASYNVYVTVNPTAGDAYISIKSTAALDTVGKFISGEYATIVPAGWYIGATSEINVTPLGYQLTA